MDQAPDENQASTFSRSPLGEPLGPVSASQRAADTLTWDLRYWLDFKLIARLYGSDPMFLVLRIEMQHDKIADPVLKRKIKRTWHQFQRRYTKNCVLYWKHVGPEHIGVKAFLRDLQRLLVKEEPLRDYLLLMEIEMKEFCKVVENTSAGETFERMSWLYQKLREKERADTEVRNRLSLGTGGMHYQGASQLN